MIRNFLRQFMIGRYGPDHLGVAMILVSLALSITHTFVRVAILLYVSYFIAGLALFRILSRNIPKRRAENDRFISIWWPIKTKVKLFFTNLKQRNTHKLINCPGCHNILRLPKGKGKLMVTCPKCGERFGSTT